MFINKLFVHIVCVDFKGLWIIIGMTILVNDCTFLQNPARGRVFMNKRD
ncbi:MAG TPA: hypothetical protein VEM96_06670 [Pyrinomonadaceae bacterium]|nr:hypothetical protein [Pyrinomonadaceae bacterium]